MAMMEEEKMETHQDHDEEDLAEETGPMMIARLQEHGVNVKDIEKLQQAGFNTVESVAYATKKVLCDIKGISEAKADKMAEVCKKLVPMGFLTASEYSRQRADVLSVSGQDALRRNFSPPQHGAGGGGRGSVSMAAPPSSTSAFSSFIARYACALLPSIRS